MNATIEDLNILAWRYQELSARLRVEQYDMPLNLQAASQAVAEAYERGERFDPQFEFASPDQSGLAELESLIADVRGLDSPWLPPMLTTLRYLRRILIDAGTGHGADKTTERTTWMFGGVQEADCHSALQELQHEFHPLQEPADLTASGTVAVFRRALANVGLGDWTASVEPHMSAMMDVTAERREIRVREGTLLSRTMVARLLVDELGCHVFRAASGIRQPIQLLGFGLGGSYTATEEGLAGYLEQTSGMEDPSDARRFALRYLAACRSLEHGFFDVYLELRRYADHQQSFETAARAKRGIADTSRPGCHVKDKAYFEGVRSISRHLREHPHDLSTLYAGKVNLEMVPLVTLGLERGDIIPGAFQPSMIDVLFAAARS